MLAPLGLLTLEAHRKLRAYERPDQRSGEQLVEHCLSWLDLGDRTVAFKLTYLARNMETQNRGLMEHVYHHMLRSRGLEPAHVYRSGLLDASLSPRARLALFLRNGADAAMTAQFVALAGDEDKPPREVYVGGLG